MSERQNARLIRTYMDLVDSQTSVFNNMINAINRQNTNLRDLINNSISYDLSSLNDDINDGTFFRSTSTSTTNNPNRNREHRLDNNNRPINRRPRRIVRRNRPSTGTNTALNTHFPRRPTSLFNNVMLNRQPFTFTSLQSVPIPNRLSPVPTINDVYNSTSTYTYRTSENTSNADASDNICPIDRQPYVDGDEIIKINHCGHTFRRRNLLNWFTRRSTCPICRYDIRSHSNTTATTSANTTTTASTTASTTANANATANTTVSFINELSNIISNTMQDVLENSDTSNNIVTAEVEFNSAVPFEFTGNVNNTNNTNNTNINQTDSSNNLVPGDDFDDIV